RHAALDLDPDRRHVAELHGVVGPGENRLREVEPDLVLVDVERGDELDVADVVAAQVDVHQARDGFLGRRAAVVMNPLDQRGGAVANPHDGHSNLVVSPGAMTIPGAHAPTSSRTFELPIWAIRSISSRRWRTRRMFSTSSEQ